MKKTMKVMALILSLSLALTMTAFAGFGLAGSAAKEDAQTESIAEPEVSAEEAISDPGDSEGGESAEGESGGESAEGESGGESAGGSDESAMAMNQDAAAATTIYTITEDGMTFDSEAGDYELTGEVGDTEAVGIDLHIDTFTTNGFKVNSGAYTIKDSVIVADVTEEVDPNAAGGYCAGVSSGVLTLVNCDFTTNGKGGRNGNYTVYCDGTGVLAVINSRIIQTGATGDPEGYTADIQDPPSNAALGISGYARSNMSLGQGQTYYYGSYVETEGWAAMSTDSARTGFEFYSYDSIGKALYGGYGTYADTSCVDWFYASVLSSPEIGAIISNNGEIHMAGGDAATEAALVYLPEDYEVSETYIANEGRSVVEAGRNDFQLHSPDMMGGGASGDYHAVLDLTDTDIITSAELDANAILVDWYEDYGPAMGEYVDFVKGANILVKSTGAYITLDNVTAESSNNVLLLTTLNSDSMSRYAKATDDMTGKGTELSICNSDITGDVDHYDYQRNTIVSLEGSTWTGAYVTIDKETWDAMWSDDCKADASCYWILDTDTYFDGEGTTSVMIMDADSVWNVSGESNINSLTVEAGAVINGIVTVDGEELDITTGGSWEGDILVVPAE